MRRELARNLYSLYHRTFNLLTGSRRRCRILVECPRDFHFFHVEPLVRALAADPLFDLWIVTYADYRIDPIPGVRTIGFDSLRRPSLRPFDICLSTEFRPERWWFKQTKLAFFLHGIGPKVSYFANPRLANYDFVLAPSPFVAEKQRPFMKSDAKLVSAGLPALDPLMRRAATTPAKPAETRRQLLLYAPSWSNDPAQISLDRDILEAIVEQDICDCVIRPHPNLMSEGEYGNPELRKALLDAPRRNSGIRLHTGPGTSIYDILPDADILMSDISSVLYEFLVFDRPVLLFLKDSVADFYDARDIVEQTRLACFHVADSSSFLDALQSSIRQPGLHATQRNDMLEKMLYNPGNATKAMVDFFKQAARDL